MTTASICQDVHPPTKSKSKSNAKSNAKPKTTSYQPVSMEVELFENSVEHSVPPSERRIRSSQHSFGLSFWILGLLNNSSYVIMIACAKSISEGGTALVFLANIIPSLSVKLSAPYWFHKTSYVSRLYAATICMLISFVLVAAASSQQQQPPTVDEDSSELSKGDSKSSSSSSFWVLIIELLGVTFGSTQAGLGEASLLALAGKVDGMVTRAEAGATTTTTTTTTITTNSNLLTHNNKGVCLTAFSSGTGMAGVFGFFWKWAFNDQVGLSLSSTLWLATILSFAYWKTFTIVYDRQEYFEQIHEALTTTHNTTSLSLQTEENFQDEDDSMPHEGQSLSPIPPSEQSNNVKLVSEMSSRERFHLVLSLWRFMIPLFIVYAAEYALQAGTWTAIGFPVDSLEARDHFYEFSNWMYQAGVFLSRSSGTLFTAPMLVLWLMPLLQFGNLGMFYYIASHPSLSIYQPVTLYLGALYTGLLGGAVYVHGYKRICLDVPMERREFSLAATSVAEGIGIVVADGIGLVIQACLYQTNNLHGALVSCPV